MALGFLKPHNFSFGLFIIGVLLLIAGLIGWPKVGGFAQKTMLGLGLTCVYCSWTNPKHWV